VLTLSFSGETGQNPNREAIKGVVIQTPDNLVVANASRGVEVIRMDVIHRNADTRGTSAAPFGEPVTVTGSHTCRRWPKMQTPLVNRDN